MYEHDIHFSGNVVKMLWCCALDRPWSSSSDRKGELVIPSPKEGLKCALNPPNKPFVEMLCARTVDCTIPQYLNKGTAPASQPINDLKSVSVDECINAESLSQLAFMHLQKRLGLNRGLLMARTVPALGWSMPIHLFMLLYQNSTLGTMVYGVKVCCTNQKEIAATSSSYFFA